MCIATVHVCAVSDLCATGDHDCEQVCISKPGSYKCACKDGFTLMEDGRSCSGELVCAADMKPVGVAPGHGKEGSQVWR